MIIIQNHQYRHHSNQPAHSNGVRTNFGKNIQEKSDKKSNRRTQNEGGEGNWDLRIILKIDENPEVKNSGNDVGSDTLLLIF